MKIAKTSIMHALVEFSDYSTIKVLEPAMLDKLSEYYGSDVVRKIRESGLYEQEGDYLYLGPCNLSANIFEEMPNIVTEEELADLVAGYMKDNGMWPTEKPISEIIRYTVDVALPQFTSAGLLETHQ